MRQANSAYHASAIAVKHATEQLEALLKEIEIVHCINRRELASSLLYVSHETFTYARNGGCAGAEVTALRAAFGEDLRKVLITNSKGMTGHAMGVCFEVRRAHDRCLPARPSAGPCAAFLQPALRFSCQPARFS